MGLTSVQYGVLSSLHGLSQGGAQPSQRELADFAGLEPMHVSKLVGALQRAGLVERTENPEDTRAVQLHVTDRGLQVVRAGSKARDGAELARTYLRAIGRRRPVWAVPVPGKAIRDYRAGHHVTPERGAGRITFDDFLVGDRAHGRSR